MGQRGRGGGKHPVKPHSTGTQARNFLSWEFGRGKRGKALGSTVAVGGKRDSAVWEKERRPNENKAASAVLSTQK